MRPKSSGFSATAPTAARADLRDRVARPSAGREAGGQRGGRRTPSAATLGIGRARRRRRPRRRDAGARRAAARSRRRNDHRDQRAPRAQNSRGLRSRFMESSHLNAWLWPDARQRTERPALGLQEADEELEQHEARRLDADDQASSARISEVAEHERDAWQPARSPIAATMPTTADDSPACASAKAPTRANEIVLISELQQRLEQLAGRAPERASAPRARPAPCRPGTRGAAPSRHEAPACERRRARHASRQDEAAAVSHQSRPRPTQRSAARRARSRRRTRQAPKPRLVAEHVERHSSGRRHSAGSRSSRANTLPNSKPEGRRGHAARNQQGAVAGSGAQREARDEQHEALADVAEHVAEQQRERRKASRPARVRLPRAGMPSSGQKARTAEPARIASTIGFDSPPAPPGKCSR